MSSHNHIIKCSCGKTLATCRCIEPKTDVKIIQDGCEDCKKNKAQRQKKGLPCGCESNTCGVVEHAKERRLAAERQKKYRLARQVCSKNPCPYDNGDLHLVVDESGLKKCFFVVEPEEQVGCNPKEMRHTQKLIDAFYCSDCQPQLADKTGEMCACECHPKRGFYKHYTNFIWECEHCQQPQGEDFWDDSNSEMLREENEKRTKVYKTIVDKNYKKMIESQPQLADPSASSGQGKTGLTKSQVRDKRSKQDKTGEQIKEILLRYQNPVVTQDEGKVSVHLDHNETVERLLALFNQEKKELLERVDKEVIGEDEETGTYDYKYQKLWIRNELRRQQREKLRRIGGEK